MTLAEPFPTYRPGPGFMGYADGTVRHLGFPSIRLTIPEAEAKRESLLKMAGEMVDMDEDRSRSLCSLASDLDIAIGWARARLAIANEAKVIALWGQMPPSDCEVTL